MGLLLIFIVIWTLWLLIGAAIKACRGVVQGLLGRMPYRTERSVSLPTCRRDATTTKDRLNNPLVSQVQGFPSGAKAVVALAAHLGGFLSGVNVPG
jgi:hypothetical protein